MKKIYSTQNHPFKICNKQSVFHVIEMPKVYKIKYILPYVTDFKLIPFCGDEVLKLSYKIEINYLDTAKAKKKITQNGDLIFINFGVKPENLQGKITAMLCESRGNILIKTTGIIKKQ
ncbi:MAG: hypothetical protein R3Y35_13080 [Clostridia bacterium]